MAKPTESLTFKKHFNNVMDYCEKDETNPDIPLYESVAYLKGYIKGMEKPMMIGHKNKEKLKK